MNKSVDFFRWLYSYCEVGNINFRFLSNGPAHNEFVPLSAIFDNQTLVEAILKDYCEFDQYFAVALRDGGGKKEDISQIPSIWLDLDGSPLCKVIESPWPPSAVIETSPGKFHCYWKLREPATKAEISQVEHILKRIAFYFKGDVNATDASRILRIPSTLNHKIRPPFKIRIQSLMEREYELSDFDDLPGFADHKIVSAGQKNDRLEKIMACKFLRHCDKDRKTLPEPEWYAMIGVLARETGGAALIHNLSQGYPKYSRQETDAKILHALNNPPMSCAKIKELWNCGQDCDVKSPVGLAFKKNKDDGKIEFPQEIIDGLAGDFASLYASYLEVPKHFFFMAFLTCLGHILADRLTLISEIAPQPRLYTLLLGESADDRKSTAINKTVEFFKETITNFPTCWGVGSAEGLQKRLDENKKLLLCFDEFKAFINKCKIETSVLLPCVNTLFELNYYESHTKTSDIVINGAYLSLLGASTIQTYENTWTAAFTDIGFNNRLFIVPGSGERRFSLPAKIPDGEKRIIKVKLQDLLHHASIYYDLNLSPEAKEFFHNWYLSVEKTIHAKRIDTYALRLMSLCAVNELKKEIDEEIIRKVLKLCDWEITMRKLHDPIDADNEVAKMEEKIRRVLLARGPMTQRELRQFTNTRKEGIWVFETAIKNLFRVQDLIFLKAEKKYSLNQA